MLLLSQEPIIDESYLNRGTVAFQFFDGVINRVVAIAIFSMNDTRKNNFGIIFFINFFYHTYTLFNLFYCIEILSMIIRWVISISVFFTDSRFDVSSESVVVATGLDQILTELIVDISRLLRFFIMELPITVITS